MNYESHPLSTSQVSSIILRDLAQECKKKSLIGTDITVYKMLWCAVKYSFLYPVCPFASSFFRKMFHLLVSKCV